jgi:hypothetical protein
VKVYHGSTVVVTEPAILRQEMGRDFGFAFLTFVSSVSIEKAGP